MTLKELMMKEEVNVLTGITITPNANKEAMELNFSKRIKDALTQFPITNLGPIKNCSVKIVGINVMININGKVIEFPQTVLASRRPEYLSGLINDQLKQAIVNKRV